MRQTLNHIIIKFQNETDQWVEQTYDTYADVEHSWGISLPTIRKFAQMAEVNDYFPNRLVKHFQVRIIYNTPLGSASHESYYCDICERYYKCYYRPLHEASSRHTDALAKRQGIVPVIPQEPAMWHCEKCQRDYPTSYIKKHLLSAKHRRPPPPPPPPPPKRPVLRLKNSLEKSSAETLPSHICDGCKKSFTIGPHTIHCLKCDRWYCSWIDCLLDGGYHTYMGIGCDNWFSMGASAKRFSILRTFNTRDPPIPIGTYGEYLFPKCDNCVGELPQN